MSTPIKELELVAKTELPAKQLAGELGLTMEAWHNGSSKQSRTKSEEQENTFQSSNESKPFEKRLMITSESPNVVLSFKRNH
jgi:hypothetical protein